MSEWNTKWHSDIFLSIQRTWIFKRWSWRGTFCPCIWHWEWFCANEGRQGRKHSFKKCNINSTQFIICFDIFSKKTAISATIPQNQKFVRIYAAKVKQNFCQKMTFNCKFWHPFHNSLFIIDKLSQQ